MNQSARALENNHFKEDTYMKKKLLSMLLATALVGTMISGCGSKQEEGGDSSAKDESADESEGDGASEDGYTIAMIT